MHNTLTEHARCLYGDEYCPATKCEQEHRESWFVEELTFADADEILAMFHELSPHVVDGFLPVWIRNLAYRLAVLQRPDDPALMREAADSLYLHGPDWDEIAADLRRRADHLDILD
ncbi:hypothetical protein OH799_19155 [Nocardia sp. NBC_00881]|uniref:hypothetical protein n=1 Tax=Nocardia sp. NBC_00881 TaxID=2975995 RepID=UPI00386A0816|nr:hypothetical protein OH799_19155 [Nocardia sp. NBC_00881]